MAASIFDTLQSNTAKVALFWAVLLIGIAVKPSRTRRIIFFPLSCLIFGSIIWQPSTTYTSYVPYIQYLLGLAAANFMCQASDFIFLNEPQLTLRRHGQEKLACDMGLFDRLSWANDLISNTRGVNWNYEAPDLRRSSTTRRGFVAAGVVKIVYSYLTLDIFSYAMRHNPAFHHSGNETMAAHGLVWQAWNAMGYWTILYSYIQLSHALGSTLMVLYANGSPQEFPDYIGPLGETTTVRQFWGRTWHQSLRRMLSAHGKHFANVFLGYPKGSFMSAYLQLFIAFIVSGMIHGTADFVATRNITSFNRNIQFFTFQALAITFEDGVIFLGKRAGFEKVPKMVGYAWVVAWLMLSGPIWFETLVRGQLLKFMLPVSVLDFVYTI